MGLAYLSTLTIKMKSNEGKYTVRPMHPSWDIYSIHSVRDLMISLETWIGSIKGLTWKSSKWRQREVRPRIPKHLRTPIPFEEVFRFHGLPFSGSVSQDPWNKNPWVLTYWGGPLHSSGGWNPHLATARCVMQATPSAVKTSPASPGSTEASSGAVGSLPSLKLRLNAPKNDGETNRNLRSQGQFLGDMLVSDVSGSVTKQVDGIKSKLRLQHVG